MHSITATNIDTRKYPLLPLNNPQTTYSLTHILTHSLTYMYSHTHLVGGSLRRLSSSAIGRSIHTVLHCHQHRLNRVVSVPLSKSREISLQVPRCIYTWEIHFRLEDNSGGDFGVILAHWDAQGVHVAVKHGLRVSETVESNHWLITHIRIHTITHIIRTRTDTRTHTYTHTYTHVHTRTHTRTDTRTDTHTQCRARAYAYT